MSLDEEDPGDMLGMEEEEEEEHLNLMGEEGDDLEKDADFDGDLEGEAVVRGTKYNDFEVNIDVFDEVEFFPSACAELQAGWADFLQTAENRDAAGEALLSAVFDGAPTIQSLFKTARAVLALRFQNALSMLINTMGDPPALKVLVETLGFQHMDFEVTTVHVSVFRDMIGDLFVQELGPRFSARAKQAWFTLMNYTGGAFIYIRLHCAERLRTLASSWATANSKRQGSLEGAEESAESSVAASSGAGPSMESADGRSPPAPKEKPASPSGHKKSGRWGWTSESSQQKEGEGAASQASAVMNANVPTTFNEMFRFNAAVMGFGSQMWMTEVLSSFDTIVTNSSNAYRLQEECDVLSLRLAKYHGTINLSEYKAVMLASLRALVPKDWNSAHEVAWSWLWDNVAQLLTVMMGQPAHMERALERLWSELDEHELNLMRLDLYNHFFAQAPAGQEYFKQSTTRLHYIADLLRNLTLDIYKDPQKIVEDISGIGLRHVGYGIPVEIIAPFVTSWVQVVRKVTQDELAEQAFRWSLSLISRIMKRVITEGSTIVMKAINANSGKMLRTAVGCAPRGKRASWTLNVQVGTQRISPFMWALESGSLDAAQAIIVDLLTIRADRDRYYFAMDALFDRHPDVIQRLCIDAPSLLPTLLDGLIWRSRVTERGMRRVNYYIRHLVVDAEGGFSKAIEWLTDGGDPKIACHPVVSLAMDLVWGSAACRTFLAGKAWLFFCVIVFITAQSILNRWDDIYAHPGSGGLDVLVDHNGFGIRLSIFAMRIFLYTCSMGRWVQYHITHIYAGYKAGDTMAVWGGVRVPSYFATWQNRVSLLLAVALCLMFIQCPVLYCLGKTPMDQLIAQRCEASKTLLLPYSICSATAMVLYALMLTDVAVFSTRVSAYVLVCGRVLSELALFVVGVLFTAITFAAAISSLEQFDQDFAGVPRSLLSLLKITLGMYNGDNYVHVAEYPAVLVAVFIYVVATGIFFLNLLVAQLSCMYKVAYQDLLGYARLNRGRILVETMPRVDKTRWHSFVASLRLEEPIEFGEGDIGIGGGVQVLEPGNANPTTVDMIRRFGGSTSRAAPWPAEASGSADDEDRFARLERLIEQSNKRIAKLVKEAKKGPNHGGGGSSVAESVSSGSMVSSGGREDA